ncbi:hypothetical protein FRACA_2210004 [Frankia canadensis]|uniref:Uncharacterized protein n=1 Tax=Frankia canadensis TaxID=1836972 RepID=A0A2I2KR30_9ACTN|nr:hypothetical protein FRACA_2210004 [Frankia canadensis]SOU55421.1 hypothetical protein FRACA_2210004 [Frankia canadensis]
MSSMRRPWTSTFRPLFWIGTATHRIHGNWALLPDGPVPRVRGTRANRTVRLMPVGVAPASGLGDCVMLFG